MQHFYLYLWPDQTLSWRRSHHIEISLSKSLDWFLYNRVRSWVLGRRWKVPGPGSHVKVPGPAYGSQPTGPRWRVPGPGSHVWVLGPKARVPLFRHAVAGPRPFFIERLWWLILKAIATLFSVRKAHKIECLVFLGYSWLK